MKATVAVTDMAKALKLISVKSAGTLPILEHVQMEVAGDMLRLRTTDLEVWHTESVPCSGSINGECAAHAGLLAAAVASGETADLSIDPEGEALRVTVSGGGRRQARFRVPALPAPGFPSEQHGADERPVEINATDLLDGIRRVYHAAPKDDIRFYLNGVALGASGSIVGTDGHRLAMVASTYPATAIVPHAAIPPLLAALGRAGAGVREIRDGSSAIAIVVFGETWRTRIRLIDGVYPDITRVLPSDKDRVHFSVDRDQLIAALRSVGAYAEKEVSNSKPSCMVRMELEEDDLHVSGAREAREADAWVPYKVTRGKKRLAGADGARHISFEGRYLLDALKLAEKTVTLSVVDSVVAMTCESGSCRSVIMPMRS